MGNISKIPTAEEFRKEVDEFDKPSTNPHHRYASFDICYGYFRRNRTTLTADMEKSCCVLWAYLGSWGMLRGSSFLLKEKNPAFLKDLIIYIQDKCQDVFDFDVDKYGNNGVIDRIIEVYKDIYTLLGGDTTNPTSTLITKIMLGVFGCIPAFDQFFCNTLGDLMPRTGIKSKIVNRNSLKAIYNFYSKYGLKNAIDSCSAKCLVANSFDPNDIKFNYSKAKIIDMYGFNAGLTKA